VSVTQFFDYGMAGAGAQLRKASMAPSAVVAGTNGDGAAGADQVNPRLPLLKRRTIGMIIYM
jgi:hypothetical protein